MRPSPRQIALRHRRDGGEVKTRLRLVDQARDQGGVPNIAFDQTRARIDIFAQPCGQIIQNRYGMTKRDQSINQMRTDKARPACDQTALGSRHD